jgi:hypothetical protein
MAKAKVKETGMYRKPPKKRRPGVHAKTKQSKNKRAKNYKKLNVGQG